MSPASENSTRLLARHKHIALICANRGIEIKLKRISWRRAESTFTDKKRQIIVPPITSDRTYFVALHEVGHLYAGNLPILERECIAWKWAISNALFKPRSTVREMISDALRSYIDYYGCDMPAGSDFWRLVYCLPINPRMTWLRFL